jgi:hypothetical protein
LNNLLTPLQALRQREHSVHPGEDWGAQHRDAEVNIAAFPTCCFSPVVGTF